MVSWVWCARDDAPLLGMISLLMPALAMGNRGIVVPSQSQPLVATDFYQVLDTSDVPAVPSTSSQAPVMNWPRHWPNMMRWRPCGITAAPNGSAMVEKASAGNLKSTWVNNGCRRGLVHG